ncbi:MAG: hypothetical protein WAT93_00345 [Pontixanthobacter sp.]
MKHSILKPALLAAATFSLGGCAIYGDYGYDGYGSGYYDPYYDTGYYGWYDDYYYPGVGYYIYDRYGTRHQWDDGHRRYWEGRRGQHQARANWDGYRRGGDGTYRDQRQRGERGEHHRGEGRRDGDRRERQGNYQGQTGGNPAYGNSSQRQDGSAQAGNPDRRGQRNEDRSTRRGAPRDITTAPPAAVIRGLNGGVRPADRSNPGTAVQGGPRRQPAVSPPSVTSAPPRQVQRVQSAQPVATPPAPRSAPAPVEPAPRAVSRPTPRNEGRVRKQDE